MKFLSVIGLFFLSGQLMAFNPQYSDLISKDSLLTTATELGFEDFNIDDQINIQALWKLTSRRCLSGAPVLDGYNPRRDTAQIRYTNDKFFYDTFINGCHFSSKGNYELQGPYIVYKHIRSTSSCGGASIKTREQNPYRLNANTLSLYFGPFVQGPAPCPMGDTLEVNYEKVIR